MENEMRKDIDKVKSFGKFLNENNEQIINKPDAFMKELSELLKKYNAEIYVDLEGDTHGVSSFIVIDIDRKEVDRFNDNLDSLVW